MADSRMWRDLDEITNTLKQTVKDIETMFDVLNDQRDNSERKLDQLRKNHDDLLMERDRLAARIAELEAAHANQ